MPDLFKPITPSITELKTGTPVIKHGDKYIVAGIGGDFIPNGVVTVPGVNGVDTSDATVVKPSDVSEGLVFYNADGRQTGTMPDVEIEEFDGGETLAVLHPGRLRETYTVNMPAGAYMTEDASSVTPEDVTEGLVFYNAEGRQTGTLRESEISLKDGTDGTVASVSAGRVMDDLDIPIPAGVYNTQDADAKASDLPLGVIAYTNTGRIEGTAEELESGAEVILGELTSDGKFQPLTFNGQTAVAEGSPEQVDVIYKWDGTGLVEGDSSGWYYDILLSGAYYKCANVHLGSNEPIYVVSGAGKVYANGEYTFLRDTEEGKLYYNTETGILVTPTGEKTLFVSSDGGNIAHAKTQALYKCDSGGSWERVQFGEDPVPTVTTREDKPYWDGYRVSWDDANKTYVISESLTSGLSFGDYFTPEVGKVYSTDVRSVLKDLWGIPSEEGGSSVDVTLGQIDADGNFQALAFNGTNASNSGDPEAVEKYYTYNGVLPVPECGENGSGGGSADFYKCTAVHGPEKVLGFIVSGAGTAAVNGNYLPTDLKSPDGESPVYKHETAAYYYYEMWGEVGICDDYETIPSDGLYYIFDSGWSVGRGVDPAPTVTTRNITINADVPKTWDGYKAGLVDGVYSFEDAVTTGLTYTDIIPEIGGIYTDGTNVCIAFLNTGFPEGHVFFDSLSSFDGWDVRGATIVEDDNRSVFQTANDGEAQSAVITTNPGVPLGNNPFSLSFWFKRTSENGSCWCGVGYGSSGTNNRIAWGLVNDYPGVTYWGHDYFQSEFSRITDTNWHHIVVTFDGNKTKNYIDGSLVWEWQSGSVDIDWEYINIGDPWENYQSNGRYADYYIYPRVLQPFEISQLLKARTV